MDRKRIFVVDDDLSILRLIAVNLECRGYQATTFNSGAQVLAQLKRAEPDLMILDLLLPEVDGIELVRLTRKVSRVPILVVSARAEVTSKLKALELGADNYLTKPFGVDELIARVRAILRRFAAAPASMVAWTYHCGDLDVDLDKSEVVLSGRRVKLSAREWAVLRIFIKYAGKVVTHRTLLQQAWGPEYGNEGDYVRTYVTRLRKKLEPEPQRPRYIMTERGMGYRLAKPNGAVTITSMAHEE